MPSTSVPVTVPTLAYWSITEVPVAVQVISAPTAQRRRRTGDRDALIVDDLDLVDRRVAAVGDDVGPVDGIADRDERAGRLVGVDPVRVLLDVDAGLGPEVVRRVDVVDDDAEGVDRRSRVARLVYWSASAVPVAVQVVESPGGASVVAGQVTGRR